MPHTFRTPDTREEHLANMAGTAPSDPNWVAAVKYAAQQEAGRQKAAERDKVRNTLHVALNGELAKLPKTPEGRARAAELTATYQTEFERLVSE